nr:HlyD family efflux transporter periplasmic adaptor subunit [Lachnospiraceae bacterium]
ALEDANTELTRLVSDVEVLAPILQKIKDLESEGGELTITAPVSGTVLSLNYAAGQTIETGAEVASIQVAGRGYTMSLSVPSEKAALVAIGDEAEISNSWWYVNVHARVKSIKNNPQNPGKEKIILFELEGDVSAGQSLSVTVGQRTATYDTIVPSSAIRSDDNGKFVLRVNTKSTPLGNRYIAERVDVTVLAEDETMTAVSGEFTGWDYIITTVTKPVEDGQQVRLKD